MSLQLSFVVHCQAASLMVRGGDELSPGRCCLYSTETLFVLPPSPSVHLMLHVNDLYVGHYVFSCLYRCLSASLGYKRQFSSFIKPVVYFCSVVMLRCMFASGPFNN